jgi:hypothetical protein
LRIEAGTSSYSRYRRNSSAMWKCYVTLPAFSRIESHDPERIFIMVFE